MGSLRCGSPLLRSLSVTNLFEETPPLGPCSWWRDVSVHPCGEQARCQKNGRARKSLSPKEGSGFDPRRPARGYGLKTLWGQSQICPRVRGKDAPRGCVRPKRGRPSFRRVAEFVLVDGWNRTFCRLFDHSAPYGVLLKRRSVKKFPYVSSILPKASLSQCVPERNRLSYPTPKEVL